MCELKDELYLITASVWEKREPLAGDGSSHKLFCKQRLLRTIFVYILLFVLNVWLFFKTYEQKWRMAELASHWSSWWAILPVPETNGVSHWCWMNDSIRSLVEPFLIHFTTHFTALLCHHSTSRMYSFIFLTHLQNKSTNKKGMMGTMKRSMFKGPRA